MVARKPVSVSRGLPVGTGLSGCGSSAHAAPPSKAQIRTPKRKAFARRAAGNLTRPTAILRTETSGSISLKAQPRQRGLFAPHLTVALRRVDTAFYRGGGFYARHGVEPDRSAAGGHRATGSPPGPGEIRLRISACGVCRTDLHVVDGELPHPRVPIIPGHEIVGRIDRLGPGVSGLQIGERIGVPWLGHTCQSCACCATGHENLCDNPEFTGYSRDGGFAAMTIADAALRLSTRRGWRGFRASRPCSAPG